MPATSKVNYEEFVEVAKKYKLRCENSNSIKGPADECWLNISKDLKYLISSKYAYIIVKENRNNVCSKLFPNELLMHTEKYDNNDKYDDSQSSCSSEIFSDDTLKFNITLSADEWGSLYDNRPQIYKRTDQKSEYRSYYTLHSHKWTSVIHEHFFEQTKLPCPIVYKYAKIYQEGQIFLKMSGHCSTCNSNLTGILTSCPTVGSRVIITCTIQGKFKSCKSRRKRRVIGDKKIEYANKLIVQNQSASFIQRTEAKNTMNYGDLVPSHIPSLNALRLIKYKTLKNAQIHENPVISISILKGTSPYNNIIKDIGHDRFFMHYWTTSEVNNYRAYAKRTRVPTISIDATGSVVKKCVLFSGRQTHNIFLYEIGVYDRKQQNQFCVAHMLSEKHDNNSISYWLTEWLRDVKSPPLIVVTDQSLALMNAVTKSFTQFTSLDAYISNCSKLISKETGTEIPKCMIRNDFNHVMHLISTWPELKSSTYRIKNFYMRAIGLIVVNTSICDIKMIIKSIFTTALNESDGINDNLEPTACENAKRYLKQRIATHTIEIDFDNEQVNELYEYDKEGTDNESFLVSTTSIFQDIKRIYDECEQMSKLTLNLTGDHDNMQYSPTLAKKLLDFCKYITCWSAVMIPIFGYGNLTESSATSESMFKDLKSIVFKHKTLPLRLDEFFITHVESIIGTMNLKNTSAQSKEDISDVQRQSKRSISEIQSESTELVSNAHDEPEKPISDTHNKTKIYISNLQNEHKQPNLDIQDKLEQNISDFTANWMGLGNPKNETKKSKYITRDPNILHCNDNSRTKNSFIGVLRNGSTSELKSIFIDKKYISLVNTCTFDSITQAMFCSYADSENYRDFVESNIKHTFMELVSHTLRDGISVQSYKKRALFLKDLFTKEAYQFFNEITIINAACTAQYMLSKIFETFPSIIEQKLCSNCLKSDTRHQICVLANLPTENLVFLPDILEAYGKDHILCEHCNLVLERKMELKEHLIIELAAPMTKERRFENNLDLNIKLKDVTKTLKIQEKIFYIRGVISFIPPVMNHKNAIGHYVAYCYREYKNIWEKYDDLTTKSKSVRPTTEAQNCQFLIYTI